MTSLQYKLVETATGATISIFLPGRAPIVAQSSHQFFEEIVDAVRSGNLDLVAKLMDFKASPHDHEHESYADVFLAARGELGAKPVAMCPKCTAPVLLAAGDVDKALLTCPFCNHTWDEFIVPDRIGAIVSWKGLAALLSEENDVTIVSPAKTEYEWTPGEAAVAHCGRGSKHLAPNENCGCGIYSGKTRAHQMRLGYAVNGQPEGQRFKGNMTRYNVLAELHLSGKVCVATNGFKAQYARIGRIIVPTNIDPEHRKVLVEALKREWEPVGVAVTEEALLAIENRAKWCPSCGTPAPEDPNEIYCSECETVLERG